MGDLSLNIYIFNWQGQLKHYIFDVACDVFHVRREIQLITATVCPLHTSCNQDLIHPPRASETLGSLFRGLTDTEAFTNWLALRAAGWTTAVLTWKWHLSLVWRKLAPVHECE